MDGGGIVIVGLRPIQGRYFADFIGGIGLGSYGRSIGQAYLVGGFSLARIENDWYSPPSRGTLVDYRSGTAIDIYWSIDQASRTLAVGAGGPFVSTTFPAESAGIPTTPIQQLSFMVWLESPSSDTAVFIDNLCAEEY
ncbi:MAG: hypothetical protein M3511_09185 [Deinococcota bacterium]|nr:hypothetical protein [Deinococcota bacterium]